MLADDDGRVDSYGVELEVTNLARTPREAAATITVRAKTGEDVSFAASRARTKCLPEGSVYWDGADQEGLQAAPLGDGPFTYEVELLLDGVHFATWPSDEIAGNGPPSRSPPPRISRPSPSHGLSPGRHPDGAATEFRWSSPAALATTLPQPAQAEAPFRISDTFPARIGALPDASDRYTWLASLPRP